MGRVLLLVVFILGLGGSARGQADFASMFGRGINLGNALEAPKEGDHGVVLEEEYFRIIREAGFRHVRIPIKWTSHAATEAPYTIDPQFLQRIDWAMHQGLDHGLAVILDFHHYDEIHTSPEAHRARFLGLWGQIATHFEDAPTSVAFELLNEPNHALDEKWNFIAAEALDVVRKTNPDRFVIIGPGHYNNFRQLEKLRLPRDPRLVATFHYYDPFHFTHQGASWVGEESKQWLGTKWQGTEKEKANVRAAFDAAEAFANANKVPMYLGEFGAFSAADMESRARWTAFVAGEARRRGIPTAYWEFCSGFGAYDRAAKAWRPELKAALLDE